MPEHFARVAGELGYETGVPNEYSLAIYDHQLPGGMTGTLKSQLAQHGMSHRLDEVLREIPRVREDLGEPIMATPFSQFVGIQAVLNVVTGERYKLVPDEVIQYTLGHYGPLMRPVQADVADRILGSPRAAEFDGWERPQPSLAEIRSRFPRTISDEELLLRYMHSDEEVDAMLNDGPVPEDPRRSSSEIVRHVAELLTEARSHTSVRITQPGLSLSMRRRAPVA